MAATKTPIVLCAATKWEAEPLAAVLGLRRASPFRFEGALDGSEVLLIKTGVGPANAREALASVPAPRLLVSTGFAGALQPLMYSGDLVLDVRGLDPEMPPMIRELAAERGFAFHFGKIVHSDKVLSSPQDKATLGCAERAAAVDMESVAVRTAAERLGVPFLAARVVLDCVDDRLPSAVPAGEGLADLVPYVLKNLPELPLMMKTGLLQRHAINRLSTFLKALLPKL